MGNPQVFTALCKTAVKADTLDTLLADISRRFEKQAAFVYQEAGQRQTVTYRQLEEHSRRVGAFLGGKVRKGEAVAILAQGSHLWVEAFFGIVIIGAVAVLLPVAATPEDLQEMLAASGARGILYGAGLEVPAKAAAEACGLSFCTALDHCTDSSEKPAQPVIITPDTPAAILFTAGTTGSGKAALLSHRNIAVSGFHPATRIPFQQGDRYLAVLPLHHIFGLTCGLLTFLYDGAEIYFNQSLKTLFTSLSVAKPATLVLVPSLAQALLSVALKNGLPALGGALRTVVVGGAPMNAQAAAGLTGLGLIFFQGYGMTECGVVCSTNGEAHLAATIGKAFDGAELKLVHDEIWVRGETVFAGYLDASLNQSAFSGNWFKTGDLGAFDAGGNLLVTGRKKFVIIAENGENVSPEELEALVGALPAVQECLVYESKNQLGRTIIAAEIYAPGADESGYQAQIAALNRKLPRHKHIEAVVLRQQEFPKNAVNKIIRNAVRKIGRG